MNTILVPIDFSEASFKAASYAVDMALVISADIMLLHIIPIPIMYGEAPVAFNYYDFKNKADEDIRQFKTRLVLKTANAIRIKSEVRFGIFLDELDEFCKQITPHLVIVGNQGRTAAERVLFGSHTIQTMKNLMWPVIAVPTDVTFSSVKKIGLASDFNKILDTTPVDEIKLLVKEFKAELHILNIGKKETFNPDTIFESGMLQELFAELKPVYHVINTENTDDSILNFAEKNNIDLLIVVPKRHNLLDALMHKSHTKHLILHSHVPVLSLHQ